MADTTARIRLALDGSAAVEGGFARVEDSLASVARAADEAQRRVGVSAAQTAAAMRQVPAQFTDIITALQGGQAPLTVFLQQGGQLKDMFGGAGAAAKALGGYVVGLINPLTVAGATLGALAVAAYQGSKENETFARAIILSGNAAGTSVGQLSMMARSMAAVSGNQGAAAEALAAFAQNAKVGRSDLQQFTGSAMVFAKATGQSVSDVAKSFAELAREPLAATLKLNEGLNFLTESAYKQIRALEEQGKKTEAARLAQLLYANATETAGRQIQANLGYVERAWNGITGAIQSAWNAVKNIGREDSVEERLAKLQVNLLASVKKRAEISGESAFAPALDKEIEKLRAQESLLQSQIKEERKLIELRGAADAQRDARIKADQEGLKYLTDQQRMQREIVEQTATLVAAGASRAEIEKRIALIRASYAQKTIGGENEVAAMRAKIDAAREYAARLSDLTIAAPKLTEAEQAVYKIQRELQGSITGTARALKEKALATAQELVAVETTVRGLERWRVAYEQLLKGLEQAAVSTDQQAASQEAANAVMGKGTTAVQAYTLAELQRQMAEAQASDRFTPQYIAALELRIKAQERYVAALNAADYKTLNAGLDEWLRGSQELARVYAEEVGLASLTGAERAKIVAQRQVELQLAKEIAKINQSTLSDTEKQALIEKARNAATVASAANTAKAVQDEWVRVTDEINRSLTDALLRGFESGKSFARNLRDTLKNMFQTMVLRPMLQPVVAGLTGALGFGNAATAGQAGAAGGGSLGNTASLLGAGDTIAKAYATVTGSFAALGDKVAFAAQDIGAWLTTNTTGVLNQAGSSIMASANTLGTVASYGGGMLAGYGLGKFISGQYTTGLGKNTLEVGGTVLGAILGGPIGAAIGGAIGGLVNRVFGMGSRQTTGQGISGTFSAAGGADVSSYSTWSQKGGWFRSSRSGTNYAAISSELDDFLDAAIGMTAKATKEYAALVGLSADAVSGFSKSVNISLMGLDAAGQEKAIADAISSFGEDLANLVLGEAGRALQARGETAAAALVRLASALGGVNDVLKSLGQSTLAASLQGADAADRLLGLFGGLDAYTQSASAYLQALYTDAERLTLAQTKLSEVMAALGLSVPGSTAAYRALVEAQDLATEGGRSTYAALLKLAPAFAEVNAAVGSTTNVLKESAQGIESEIQRLRGLITGTGSANAASLQADFALTTAAARAGDAAALQRLPGISQALEAAAALQATTAADLARLRGQLSASLEATLQALGLDVPQFAVGTNYVPRDMLAQIHEGEAIVPRAYNPAAGGQGSAGNAQLEAKVERMSAVLDKLVTVMEADVSHNAKTARILERITPNGTALNTVVEAA